MGTPTVWLQEFQINTGLAAVGTQKEPQIIGLSNGNILVTWEESTDGAIGVEDGTDIIAKLLDAEGNVIRDSFTLKQRQPSINREGFNDNEGDYDIAATNDGGFVVTFIEDENDGGAGAIRDVSLERFDGAGEQVDFITHLFFGTASRAINRVTSDPGGDTLSNPQVAVNLIDNSMVVSYTAYSRVDDTFNVIGKRISANGILSDAFETAPNNSNNHYGGDLAVLSTGQFIQVYTEDNAGINRVAFQRFDSAGIKMGAATGINGVVNASDPQVISLAGGGFVVAYVELDAVRFRIYNNLGVPTTAQRTVASNFQNEPELVALPDGDFFIIWDDDDRPSNILGRRYNPDGTADGSVVTVSVGGAGSRPNLGVTGDGRILTVHRDNGEIYTSILDPRAEPIQATDYSTAQVNFVRSSVITSMTTASSVEGGHGNETIFGHVDADRLTGEIGQDRIQGRGGNDWIDGGGGADTLGGDEGDDTLIGGIGSDSLKGKAGNDVLFGNSHADTLNGGEGDDWLYGGAQNDILAGTLGRDRLNGSVGDDTLYGGTEQDTLSGSRGNDLLIGGAASDWLNGADNINFGVGERDTLSGGRGTQDIFQLGNATTSYYLDSGAGGTSHATILDFESLDRIILNGSSRDYRIVTRGRDSFLLRLETGADDTVGIITNTVGLNLDGAQFLYI